MKVVIKENIRKKMIIGGGLLIALLLTTGVELARPKHNDKNLNFSHSQHLKELGLDCQKCHPQATTSQTGKDRLLPGHNECNECHDVNTSSECGTCHREPFQIVPQPFSFPYYDAFSHYTHSSKVNCQGCHLNVEQDEKILTGRSFPDMKGCYDCHQKKRLIIGCRNCHLTVIPPPPISHQDDWTKRHGQASRLDRMECDMCHQVGAQNDCQQCHQGSGLTSPHPQKFIHSQNYLRGKGFVDCQSCHQAESFCASCHIRQMVIPFNHHRPGWANSRDGGIHARQAEAEFDYCIICHTATIRQASCFTAGCHK